MLYIKIFLFSFFFFQIHTRISLIFRTCLISMMKYWKSDIFLNIYADTDLQSISPHLDYNSWAYIRNVIIGRVYQPYGPEPKCALVHTSIMTRACDRDRFPVCLHSYPRPLPSLSLLPLTLQWTHTCLKQGMTLRRQQKYLRLH